MPSCDNPPRPKPWGVFEVVDEAGRVVEVHVAPTGPGGDLAPGHVLDEICVCGPRVERHHGCLPLVIHRKES
ncbi:MAG: hypothetical protein AB7D57_07735 [Desulfovibrionaceae bacterium]